MCSALVDLVKSAPEHLRGSQKLVERILLPLITRSRDNNSRWTSIFLRKYNASDLAPGLPKVPAKPKLLQILLENFPLCMPVSEFEILSDFIASTKHPPQGSQDLAEQLAVDPQAYKRNDVRHWRDSTAPPAPNSVYGTSNGILNVLQRGQFAPADKAAAESLITPAHLQAHEHRMLERTLNNYPSNPTAWDQYLDRYKPPLDDDEQLEPRLRWRQYCRPIIQHAISLVSALRTPAWQKNSQRECTVLPDTFALRLRLLAYPSLYPSPEQEKCLDEIASEARQIIDGFAFDGRPYHNQWRLLMSALKQCAQRHWVGLALRLGRLDDPAVRLNMSDLLLIDAAEELLTAFSEKGKGKGLQAAEGMVRAWRESGEEEVRTKGIRVGKLM
jgi:hypothetical protein